MNSDFGQRSYWRGVMSDRVWKHIKSLQNKPKPPPVEQTEDRFISILVDSKDLFPMIIDNSILITSKVEEGTVL